jgi:Na+/proline symporter/signal transduction histidine kinase
MFAPFFITIAVLVYISFLFILGLVTEKNINFQQRFLSNPLSYSLGLTVYLTSWTFYGAVGLAADYGLLLLTFYIGATLSTLVWWIVIRKLVRIKNEYHITSIADFLSARYNKSALVAALVTIIAFVGGMPYIAIQLRAIIVSFTIITTPLGAVPESSFYLRQVGPLIVIAMIVFTIIIGVRRLDPTERHPGIIATLTFDGILKLVVFVVAGFYICYHLFDGLTDIFNRFSHTSHIDLANLIGSNTNSFGGWITRILLSMAAIIFLPRQFHMAIIENSNEKHIRTAMWFIPLYMFVFTFFTYPIAIAGLLKGYLPQEADFIILKLPFVAGNKLLSFIVFLGGFSAATGMVIIASMTIAIMITNHLLLPVVDKVKKLTFIKQHLLQCRWVVVAFSIVIGYWFERKIEATYLLAQIGSISFAAVFQFLPAIIGGLFWRKGNKTGALLGLSSGFIIWFYTSLIPLFIKSGWMSRSVLSYGPLGIIWLRPEQLFGISFSDPLTHSVVWSISMNTILYIVGSLYKTQTFEEQNITNSFINIFGDSGHIPTSLSKESTVNIDIKLDKIKKLLAQYLPPASILHIVSDCLIKQNIQDKKSISILELSQLLNDIEINLAGSIGAASAHKALKRAHLFTRQESRELSKVYAEILAELNITPEEMRQRINYYHERESILINQAGIFEELLKKRTAQLEAMHSELLSKEKLATLGQLTATVSHELRNPLGTIKSSLYSLGKRIIGHNDKKIYQIIERAERNVERCDLIIDELLEYTRIKELQLEPVQIGSLIKEILSEIHFPNYITVNTSFSSNLTLNIDKERIRRCLINLINNSIQSLEIKFSKTESTQGQYFVTIYTNKISDRFEIIIEDTGIGIPSDKIQKIFEPLYSTKNFGVGLGLSIVKQIIESHGGSIHIESEINGKTRAILWLQVNK